MGQPEPGWYESEGRKRWWDGDRWADRYLDEEVTPVEPPPPPTDARYDPAMDAKAAPDLQPKKSSSWTGWTCGGCVVVPIIAVAILFAVSAGGDKSPYDPDNASEAVAQCEDLVTGQLRAPSTAEFDSSAAASGSGTWTVTGTVDSQNGFGAQVRSSYGCTMRVTNGKIERRLDYLG